MTNHEHWDGLDTQAYLAAIVSSSDDAIISQDLNGNITSWNPGAERVFGYTAAEAIGRHMTMLIPPEHMPEQAKIFNNVKTGESISNHETQRRRKDGSLVDLSIAISPIKSSDGEVIGISKVARDITQLREADRASAYLGAIIASSDDAIISKDLNGYITSWNQSAERIFGYTAAEAIGKHITLLIPTERITEEDSILTTLKTGSRIDHFETVRRHKDGHLVNVSLTVSPIKDRNGKIVGASKVSRDISYRLKAEESLQEMSRKKDEFMANMSHELRTPMNAVIGIAGILKAMQEIPDHAKKLIDTLKFSADNMMDLVNDLLDYAKIEAGAFSIESVDFNLGEQIGRVASVMGVKAREKGLKLHVDLSTSLNGCYKGDPLRISQVITNLLSNAVKFTENGSINIEVGRVARSGSDTVDINIRVTDTGIGIPEDKLDVIFDKFTQADASITRRYGGSGLGLSISKSIVEKLGGTIKVESQINKGTTFTVVLPLIASKSESNTGALEIEASDLQEVIKREVLLVEDYEPNIIVASTLLESLGFNFDIARTGSEALRAFSKRNYDVILMDIQMSDLDGLEATRRIRMIEAEKGLRRTPIVAMTAHVREQDKAACFDAGMDDFLPKPFEAAHFAEKLRHFTASKKNSP